MGAEDPSRAFRTSLLAANASSDVFGYELAVRVPEHRLEDEKQHQAR
jgi:hypothetical protein